MAEVVAVAVPLGVLLVCCLLPALGTARTLLGLPPRPLLPALRDRCQVLEQSATAVFALALAALVAPWHALPVALWGLGAAATALITVGGALAAPALPPLSADADGRRRPRSRVVSALVAVALAALVVLAQL